MSSFPYYPRSSLKRAITVRDLQDLVPFPNFFIFDKELPIVCKCVYDGTDFLVLNNRDITTLYHNGAFGISKVTYRDPLADQRDDSFKHQPYFQKATFLANELIIDPDYQVPVNEPRKTLEKETVSRNTTNNDNHNSASLPTNANDVHVQEQNSSLTQSSSKQNSNATSKQNSNANSEEDVLLLMPEEVIFLTFGVGCLSVQDVNGKVLPYEVIWNMMVKQNPEFPILYAVYHYFRCKNWVPKNGNPFGGDYILYEYGPKFSHATYIVHIFGSSRPDPTWMELYARQRCAVHSSKLALICRVSTPKNFVPSSPMSIFQLNIQETTIHRWKP